MKTIKAGASSSRSSVTEYQAQLMARFIRMLESVVNRDGHLKEEHEWIYDCLEYQLLVQGAYALGFVCRDFSIGGIDLEVMIEKPEMLADMPLQKLRHYLHILMRAERASVPWNSHVLEAIKGGSLGVIATRLESDCRLRIDAT